jgi:predicted transcriptional regulator
MSTVTRSIRVDEQVLRTFEKLAETTGRSANYLMAEALSQYADEMAYLAAFVEEGLRDTREGRVLSEEASRAALERLTTPEARRQAHDEAQGDPHWWDGD